MKLLCLNEKYNKPIAIALGFFDCIHKGHRLLVQTACEYAKANMGVESALFTFSNDPSELLGKEKQIYSFAERSRALSDLGMENLLYSEFNCDFAQLKPTEFLNLLISNFNIRAIITGSDYTFGKDAKGNIEVIKAYCSSRSIDIITVPFEKKEGQKISTSAMKKLVTSGDVGTINSLLTEAYFMLGKVVHARHVGTKLGFPTANIRSSSDKLPLADGVYATVLQVDNKKYASMTNVGSKPTFDIDSPSIETYILDFNDNIYGKTVKLSYIEHMRDIKRFASAEDLKAQLVIDEERVRKLIVLE